MWFSRRSFSASLGMLEGVVVAGLSSPFWKSEESGGEDWVRLFRGAFDELPNLEGYFQWERFCQRRCIMAPQPPKQRGFWLWSTKPLSSSVLWDGEIWRNMATWRNHTSLIWISGFPSWFPHVFPCFPHVFPMFSDVFVMALCPLQNTNGPGFPGSPTQQRSTRCCPEGAEGPDWPCWSVGSGFTTYVCVCIITTLVCNSL